MNIVEQFQEEYHLTLDSISSGKKDYIGDYYNFMKLRGTATKSELTELVNHPNAVVRCYSFWALSQYDSSNLLSCILAHSGDTALQVNAYIGSFHAIFSVKDFFLNVISNKHYNLGKVTLTKEQKRIIDSIDKQDIRK